MNDKWLDLTNALARIKTDWTTQYNDFTDGDCHTLAVALYQAMDYQGVLYACLRDSFNEDGLLFSTGYSHMVHGDPNGVNWDINGSQADTRWEDDFNFTDTPDEHGLVHAFRWVNVPYDTYQCWLQEHFGAIDNGLTDKLTQALRLLLHIALLSAHAQTEPEHASPGPVT